MSHLNHRTAENSTSSKLARMLLGVFACWLSVCGASFAAGELRVLFLGDNGAHQPRQRFAQLEPVLRARGIELTYTDQITDLNTDKLAKYQSLLLYANIDRIEPAEEEALLKYVEGGGGFVPIHCASYCFRNSDRLVALMGAQFRRHGWARMRESVHRSEHPVSQNYGGFESWDETYVHHLHNEKDRIVLSHRIEGDAREPWTWVRTQGEGRIFYTAWGHDWHTWAHPGFHNLIERGIRWAARRDPSIAGAYVAQAPFDMPTMTKLPEVPAPFQYIDVGAKIPNYIRGKKWGEQGEPQRLMQKPLSPAESMRRMVVPEGFHVELFAAEPELAGKPLCLAWDERGRLWLGESIDYPNELAGKNRGRDRIRICEDTTEDGLADKFTVFADNLSIPTSLAFARGGVLVHNGTETIFLKDTDGDDRADERSVLLAGWSMGDTHGGPSNMQYGLDNWMWGMQGYNKSAIRIGDKATSFAQGFHRFRPDGSAIEFIRSTNNNTWGFGTSEEGIIFGSTANGHPSIYMPIANRYYERVRGWTPPLTLSTIADNHEIRPITDKVRQVDHHGGFTAAAGHALYTARAFPRPYWNRTAFVCEPTGHLVSMFLLTPDGADYHATSPGNLLASDDEWTAPTMAEVGPDGSVWVIDWYNYIVQHNPTPEGFETGKGQAYVTDLRDKRHARIYRVVHDSNGSAPSINLSRATPSELVATLKNGNLFWRRHAQRLLVERGKLDVVPKLLLLVRDTATDAMGLNVGAIHALWTLNGLGALDGSNAEVTAAAVAALRHPSAGVRRNAVQVLLPGDSTTSAILDAKLLVDSDPQVRLQSLLALADAPSSAAAGRAVSQFVLQPENNADRWLVEAATSAAAAHAADFLMASAACDAPPAKLCEVCKVVSDHFARTSQGSQVQKLLLSLVSATPELAGAIIEGLDAGSPQDAAFQADQNTRQAIEQILSRLKLEDQLRLVSLSMRNRGSEMQPLLKKLTSDLFAKVNDGELEVKDRLAAADLFVAAQLNDADVAEQVLDLATPQAPPELSRGVFRALRQSKAPELASAVLNRIEKLTPAARDAAYDLLLSWRPWTVELLDAIEKGTARASDLSLVQKQQLAQYPDLGIRARAASLIEKGQGSISEDRKQVLAQFVDITRVKADAIKGKEVFAKHCATCHKYQGVGASVGPDLSGMSVHGKEQLLGQILDPNRDVEGNYQAYMVVLEDGRVLNGLLAGESNTTIDLIDPEGKLLSLLREEIEELSKTGSSLMPEGFEKHLARDELADLLEFLTARGKFVPMDLRRAATVSSAYGMFQTPGSKLESLMFDDWGVKTFEGVPFYPVDPQEGRVSNVIMLRGDQGTLPPNMPRSVELPCGLPAKAIHFLSGVSGWGFPATKEESLTMMVRLHYSDGAAEEHPLKNGVHFADYLGHADVRGSKAAFSFGRQQLRYFMIEPKRIDKIDRVELVKGEDRTAPVVMCMTLEQP